MGSFQGRRRPSPPQGGLPVAPSDTQTQVSQAPARPRLCGACTPATACFRLQQPQEAAAASISILQTRKLRLRSSPLPPVPEQVQELETERAQVHTARPCSSLALQPLPPRSQGAAPDLVTPIRKPHRTKPSLLSEGCQALPTQQPPHGTPSPQRAAPCRHSLVFPPLGRLHAQPRSSPSLAGQRLMGLP